MSGTDKTTFSHQCARHGFLTPYPPRAPPCLLALVRIGSAVKNEIALIRYGRAVTARSVAWRKANGRIMDLVQITEILGGYSPLH